VRGVSLVVTQIRDVLCIVMIEEGSLVIEVR